jgi:glycyl-tRNA synthetase
MAQNRQDLMSTIVSLCKRRGFIFQSSEIYGGLNSCWDYGPLGVELKRNVKEAWWNSMVSGRRDIVGLDASILMHPKVWEASGHLKGFTDPLVDCLLTKKRFRADHIEPKSGVVLSFSGARDKKNGEEYKGSYSVLADSPGNFDKARKTAREFYRTRGISSPDLLNEKMAEVENATGYNPENGGELTPARNFNLMFKTFMGPVEDESAVVYMRPETAQGIFVNFLNVQSACRLKLPFGIAQIGKSFRNEITPGNFIYRTREFEQMEMEFFIPPSEDEKWYTYWIQERLSWYIRYGIKKENLKIRDHEENEMAHYAKACADIEYKYPFGGWGELEGIANRTDYDLRQHSQSSGKNLALYDEESKTHLFPYVIEPAAGADRAALAFLLDAYRVEGEGKNRRTILGFHPAIAPIKVAVLPLVKRDGMPELAEKIYSSFLVNSINSFFDTNSSIGRRYARQDEAGTPFCVTVDSQTLEDGTVTVRERDTRDQYRISTDSVVDYATSRLKEVQNGQKH